MKIIKLKWHYIQKLEKIIEGDILKLNANSGSQSTNKREEDNL